jgi:hypothetical protein
LGVGCAAGLLALFPADVGAALGGSAGTVNLGATFNPILRHLYRTFYWTVRRRELVCARVCVFVCVGVWRTQKQTDTRSPRFSSTPLLLLARALH